MLQRTGVVGIIHCVVGAVYKKKSGERYKAPVTQSEELTAGK